MKRLIALAIVFMTAVWAYAQSQLAGTIQLPDGSGFTGALFFSLAQNAGVSSISPCTGPTLVVPTEIVKVVVTNGTMLSPPILTSSTCTNPIGVPYNVLAIDASGTVAFTDQWLVTGATFDVGTAQSSNPGPAVNFKAAWSSVLNYTFGDMVTYGSSTYVSLENNNLANIPGASPGAWQQINNTIGAFPSGSSGVFQCYGGATTFSSCPMTTNGSATNSSLPFGAAALQSAKSPAYDVTAAPYGAVGDCTGTGSTSSCTDNTIAVQNAFNAAYLTGGAVFFPLNVNSSTSPTVYYVSSCINPKGVSFYGPPSAGGPSISAAASMKVGVRGAPGKDVFCSGDPAAGGFVVWLRGFAVKDIGIIVDSSTDVSASNTTRRPGRTVTDASMTASSAVINSTTADFQPGDVGQAISVAGAGSGGATLTTTIASVAYYDPTTTTHGREVIGTQATLAATASTTVTNATTYISVWNLPVTQNIGNCGWAMDDAQGRSNSGTQGLFASTFDNVVMTTTGSQTNSVCGYFIQGQWAPYQSRWLKGSVLSEFGFVYAPQDNGPCLSGCGEGDWDGMGDTNQWNNIWIGATYSFLAYDGGMNEFHPSQVSGADSGPQIIGAYGIRNTPLHWAIYDDEQEPGLCATANPITFRIDGFNHRVPRLGIAACSGSVFQWDANDSTVEHFNVGYSTTVNIAGYLNDFDSTYTADALMDSDTLNVTGWGNRLTSGRQGNPVSGIQPARRSVGGAGTSFAPPLLSRSALALALTHDFIDKGGLSYYFNGEDLWVWPYETAYARGGDGPAVVVDSSSVTGSAMVAASGTTSYIDTTNAVEWVIGKQIPATKVTILFSVKAASATTGNLYTFVGPSFPGVTCSGGFSVTTSYTTLSCDADFTGDDGQGLIVGFSPAGSVAIDVAWFAFRPWSSSEKVNGPITATSYQLSGSSVVATQTSGTWTPTDASGGSIAFTVSGADYNQIGNWVYATANILYPTTADTHAVCIGGLPVAVGANAGYVGTFLLNAYSITLSSAAVGVAQTGTNEFCVYNNGGWASPVINSTFSGARIEFTAIYPAS